MIKKLKEFITLTRHLKNTHINLAWFKIVQRVMEFALDVQQHGKPMLTKIAVIDMSEEKVVGDFDLVSLWAGVGEANPIERSRQLKDQNLMLKDLLERCLSKTEVMRDGDLFVNIKLAIDTF